MLADREQVSGVVREIPDTVQALIAARLDTLSPGRKSLLQDASVVGKVFWSGALAELGGRAPLEVERPCTSSRARSSCAPHGCRRWRERPSTVSGTRS